MLRESDVLSTLMRRRPDHSLAQELYCDSGVFDADLSHIWYREWLFSIPACEIPKAGNYVVHDVGAYSVVIVRGNDGEIRAFHNSCRHRGSVLCKSKKGTHPKLVCPYHQWTYELDGRLLWAREMGPDFDASKHGLKHVHCRDVSGMVYICLADVAPPIEDFAAEAARYMAPHDLANSKVAHESTIIEHGNWKLVWENNRECYHCAGNHPSLCRTFPEDPRAIGSDNSGELSGLQRQHSQRCEAAGAPSAFLESSWGDWRFVRTPLLDGAESYTMDGKVASTRPNSTLPFRDAGSLLKYKYPGCWNHLLSDHVILFRVTPIGPMETEVRTTWLVHKDAVEGQDYDLKRLTEVWIATNNEDREVVENNQRGIRSPAYEPGPYSPIHEGGNIQFVDWYASTMIRSITGTGAATLAAE
ncbi:aromatic ring-hydroxylating dioxygenase subunit alpha [Silicimonas algicola]|uniref:Rieske 2Fe-2S family protein n=1 Tax=Silicimonas algicola TaxID=1826607 RepID=A0A316G486_9RHOB|nr:aromatic ring-hydroxylating dioxygenase subunit alpha [Silicimonas algicola]AZQ67073.1 aromatic ring-hydroxylating dioxygenase subunit alpha [Silicimonas algicola]PWK55402.1 Rieske 2Fe-2S family protein [Silicimonas algicola]